MKTVFDLYHWPHPDAAAEITYGYPTAEAAAEATGSTAYAWHRTANGDGWLLDATFDAARPTGNATPSSATYSTRSKPQRQAAENAAATVSVTQGLVDLFAQHLDEGDDDD